MKKKILLFTAIAGLTTIAFSSYHSGAANNGYDCTGAETAGSLGNFTSCAHSGCHGAAATPTIGVAIELDSAGGVPTTHYKAGLTYTVKITGTNGTGNTLPKYGFQLAAIKGTSAIATVADAGTFATTGLPASTHITAPQSGATLLTIAEQSLAISVSGTTFTESFTWTAPASGTGAISFWGAVNFVNGNALADTADKNNTNSVSINEWSTTGVANVNNTIGMTVYPNPVVNTLNIRLDNAAGNYDVAVIDLNGRVITTDNITASTSISTANWAAGMYYVVVKGNGATKTVAVVKQ